MNDLSFRMSNLNAWKQNRRTSGMPESCSVTALNRRGARTETGTPCWFLDVNVKKKKREKRKRLRSRSTPDMSPEALEQKAVLKHGWSLSVRKSLSKGTVRKIVFPTVPSIIQQGRMDKRASLISGSHPWSWGTSAHMISPPWSN